MTAIQNICNCYSGLIGLRGICDPAEDCMLYLNQLPGINNQIVSNLTNIERETIGQVFNDIEIRASVALDSLIKSKLKTKYNEKRSSGIISTGRYDKLGEDQFTDSSHTYGTRIDLSGSTFNEVTITEIRIYSAFPVNNIEFHVFNLGNRRWVSSVVADLVDGINIIQVDDLTINTNGDDIYIGIDGGLVQTKPPITDNSDCYCSKPDHLDFTKCGECDYQKHNCYRYDKTGSIDSNTVLDLETGEVSECRFAISYVKKCSWSSFLCQSQEELKIPFWYALGIEFWNEPGFGKYIGTFQLVDEDWKGKQIEDLTKKMEQAIDVFIDELPVDNVCFECFETYEIITQIP